MTLTGLRSWFERGYLVLLERLRLPEESVDAARHKANYFLFYTVLLAITCVVLIKHASLGEDFVVDTGFFVTTFLCLAWALGTKHAGSGFFVTTLIIAFTNVVRLDINVMSSSPLRIWPFLILILDVLLFVEAPRMIAHVFAFASVLWIVVSTAEAGFRFGMLDAPFITPPYADRRWVTECGEPPCATGVVLFVISTALGCGVFVLNFVLTRQFADRVIHEREMIKNSVTVAHCVAKELARFDLEAAMEHLDARGDALPAELREEFLTLVGHLGSYRPFLPREMFSNRYAKGSVGGHRNDYAALASSPIEGSKKLSAAIAVTDIRHSTALWMHSNTAMREALLIYHATIRDGLAACGGYEVKTMGDSFMIAFSSAFAAVTFGIDVQNVFGARELWPGELHRPALSDGFDVFSAYIAIDYGVCYTETNSLTARTDYFGPTVTCAMHATPHAIGGAVTVTERTMYSIVDHLDTAEVIVIPYQHVRHAKSIRTPLHLTALLPASLRRLEAKTRSVCDEASEGTECHMGTLQDGDFTLDMQAPTPQTPQQKPMTQPEVAPIWHTATVGVISFNIWDDDVFVWNLAEGRAASALECAHTHAARSGGMISTVMGSMVLLSWGVYSRRNQHVPGSTRFLVDLYQSQRNRLDLPSMHAGLGTGHVSTRQLTASPQQRFITLMGPCVDLAMALCSAAAELSTTALVAAMPNIATSQRHNTDTAVGAHMRPVDIWAADASSGRDDSGPPTRMRVAPVAGSPVVVEGPQITVFEMCLPSLVVMYADAERNAVGAAGPLQNGDVKDAWSAPYWRAFQQGDAAVLEGLAEGPDPTLLQIGRLVRGELALQRALVPMLSKHHARTAPCSLELPSLPAVNLDLGGASRPHHHQQQQVLDAFTFSTASQQSCTSAFFPVGYEHPSASFRRNPSQSLASDEAIQQKEFHSLA